MTSLTLLTRFSLLWAVLLTLSADAAQLKIGSAQVDITPDRPVALAGQFHLRVATKAETPLVGAVIAVEALEGDRAVDHAIFVTCDLVSIGESILAKIRTGLGSTLPGFDTRKLIVSATHTHTAPVTTEIPEEALITYPIPKEGVMPPAEYVDFLVGKLTQAITKAWAQRAPGGVSWTLGYAMVGENRRSLYSDCSAVMYGPTPSDKFTGMEAGSDSGVESLFFWDANKNLKAVAINLACPSQEVEGREQLNADFWHDTREQLRTRLNAPDLTILGWCSAAGDQSPHPQYRKAAETRMEQLRGLSRLQELGRRISGAVADTLDAARKDIRTDVPFAHNVETIELSPRIILEREYRAVQRQVDEYSKITQPDNQVTTMLMLGRDVMRRFEAGHKCAPYPMELHVLRLGDVALATNTFELFLDWGTQMKARSPAMQTFVLQLTNGSGAYLPTALAIQGGSYSAIPHVNKVGPEGGRELVTRTLELMKKQFADTGKKE